MKKSTSNLYLRFAFALFLLSVSLFVSAQWVRQSDGLKPRAELGETIVYNSKLYTFVGFSDTLRHAEPSSEVYDPANDTWTYLASMPANAAMTHQDVILIDNTVWHIGGRVGTHPGAMSSVIWIYNITANSWSRGPEIRDPATGDPMVIAATGSVLLGRVLHIFGGFTPTACNDQDKYHLTLDVDTWLLNPLLPAQWENKLKPLPLKRNHLSAVTLGGKIYAIGGQLGHDCGTTKDVDYCHVYNPSTDTWKALPPTPSIRSHAEGSTFAMDGKIYVVGGQATGGGSTTRVTIFDPAGNNGAGTWTEDKMLVLPKICEGMSSKVIGTTFIISHGSHGSSKYPAKDTYTRTIVRNPVYKMGFPAECLKLHDSSASSLKGHTWLFTIDGTKNYTTSSNATWLTVSKNATGIANPNAVDIEVTANTAGLVPGNYAGVITATGIAGGTNFTAATLCVSLTVQRTTGLPTYNLLVTPNGIGTVNKSPNQSSYASGSNVGLTAVPGTGQQFNGWSGDASGTANPLMVNMNAAKSIIATFVPVQYNLTVTTSGGGTVTKSPNLSTFSRGATVTLTANPGTGQQFIGWSGSASETTNPLSITMDATKDITANFQQEALISHLTRSSTRSYAISQLKTGITSYTDRTFKIASVPAFLNLAPFIKTPNDDKTSKASSLIQFTLTHRATVYVAYDPAATALPAWLSGWQKSSFKLGITYSKLVNLNLYSKVYPAGNVVIGGNMASPAAGAQNNYIVIAVAEASQYALTANTNGNGSVTKDPDQTSYASGSTVSISATPAAGYQFTGWNGAATGTANPLSVNMTAAKTITANFSAIQYALTANTNGNGSVTKDPNQTSYASGATVSISATPAAGYQFSGWSGAATGTANPLSVIMTAAKTVTANFSALQYSLTANTNGNGSIAKSPHQPSYVSGSTLTLTATPAAGYQFTGWSGDATGLANPLSVTMDASKNITANFSAIEYELIVNNDGNGNATKSPDQLSYASGSMVTVTATPAVGYQFSGWSGAATGLANPLSVTMDASKNITANFSAIEYELIVNNDGNGSATKSPDQLSYTSGSMVTVTATPADGYEFSGWSGSATGLANPLSVIMDASKNITANFSAIEYELIVNNDGNGSATKSPDQPSYVSGSMVTVTATPADGYKFTGWSGSATGTDNPLFVVVDATKNITANFEPVSQISLADKSKQHKSNGTD